jgi:hypothetical protein
MYFIAIAQHMAASLLTSLSLGTRLERRGDTTDQIVRALIIMMTPGVCVWEDVTHGNLITKDRGYNNLKVSNTVLSCGVHELGTRKR